MQEEQSADDESLYELLQTELRLGYSEVCADIGHLFKYARLWLFHTLPTDLTHVLRASACG